MPGLACRAFSRQCDSQVSPDMYHLASSCGESGGLQSGEMPIFYKYVELLVSGIGKEAMELIQNAPNLRKRFSISCAHGSQAFVRKAILQRGCAAQRRDGTVLRCRTTPCNHAAGKTVPQRERHPVGCLSRCMWGCQQRGVTCPATAERASRRRLRGPRCRRRFSPGSGMQRRCNALRLPRTSGKQHGRCTWST